MQYRMVTQATTGHIGRDYTFDIACDDMAITYASSHAIGFANCSWFEAILLFNCSKEQEELIAVITLDKPEVKVILKP